MSQIELRTEIIQSIKKMEDLAFLKAVHSMISAYVQEQETNPIIGYSIDGKPKYANDMKVIYDSEVKAALEQGSYITIDQLKKKSSSWINPTE